MSVRSWYTRRASSFHFRLLSTWSSRAGECRKLRLASASQSSSRMCASAAMVINLPMGFGLEGGIPLIPPDSKPTTHFRYRTSFWYMSQENRALRRPCTSFSVSVGKCGGVWWLWCRTSRARPGSRCWANGGWGWGVVVGGWWLLACYTEPIKSGAKVGTSDASLTSYSPLIIFEHSMVVVFFELRNVVLMVLLDSARQLFVVWFI